MHYVDIILLYTIIFKSCKELIPNIYFSFYNANIFVYQVHWKFFFFLEENNFIISYIYIIVTVGKIGNTKAMFSNSFCFLFSKTCFWEYKEKTVLF